MSTSNNENDDDIIKEKSSLYVQIQKEIKDTLEKLKEREGTTQSTIIEQAITFYHSYSSMPQHIKNLIRLYAGEYGNSEFLDNQIKAISDIVEKYNESKTEEKSSEIDIWLRAKKERGMMLIGKTTFNQLIAAAEDEQRALDKPQEKNNALDVIIWYTGKPLRILSLEEILDAIKQVYTVANYFDRIEIRERTANIYDLMLYHQQDFKFSDYWLGYFRILFNNLNKSEVVPFECEFKGEAHQQTISVSIKETINEKD